MAYLGLGTLGTVVEGGSPRSEETLLKAKVEEGVVIPPTILKSEKSEEAEIEKKPEPKPSAPKNPPVTESLPHAFRKSRGLYPKEIAYLKEEFGPSLRYDKIRLTRDHWLSYGSTHVIGNTIHFTSFYAGEPIFEDTPEWHLTPQGLDLLGHEAMHVWQYQHGGIAYIGDSVTKQAAGYYSTGSRNTAYDWQTAFDWDVPWEKWGPEQQAQAIDDWNLAKRGHASWSGAATSGGKELVEKLQPYADKVQRGEGAPQFSILGTIIMSFIFGGIGYIWKKKQGALYGVSLGILINLPWNKWFLKKPGLEK